MKKICIASVLIVGLAACGDNSAGSDQSMYDTSAAAISGPSAERDSLAAKAIRDSAAAKKTARPDSTSASGGGLPQGTIDSGMTNAGAQKGRKAEGKHHHNHK